MGGGESGVGAKIRTVRQPENPFNPKTEYPKCRPQAKKPRKPHDLTAEQRLQGWQQARLQQGLSGEFALSAQLGKDAATEEQIRWIADMYGR